MVNHDLMDNCFNFEEKGMVLFSGVIKNRAVPFISAIKKNYAPELVTKVGDHIRRQNRD